MLWNYLPESADFPALLLGVSSALAHQNAWTDVQQLFLFVGLYRTSAAGPCSEASASHPSNSNKDRWSQMRGRWLVRRWHGVCQFPKGPWGFRTQPFPAAVSPLDVETGSLSPSSPVLSHSGKWGGCIKPAPVGAGLLPFVVGKARSAAPSNECPPSRRTRRESIIFNKPPCKILLPRSSFQPPPVTFLSATTSAMHIIIHTMQSLPPSPQDITFLFPFSLPLSLFPPPPKEPVLRFCA